VQYVFLWAWGRQIEGSPRAVHTLATPLSLVAFDSWQSEKNNKHANREPGSCNHLGAFYVTCFARVCEIFTAVGSESNVVHTLCFKVFMPPYICAVCLFFLAQIRQSRCETYKKNVGNVFYIP